MNRLLAVLVFALAAPVAAADAASAKDLARCQAMSATFGPKQKEITKLKEARDAQAEAVESKGEAWDDLEVLRNASAANAEKADAAKAEYEAARKDLARLEQGLQASVSALNADVNAYNKSYTTEK